ncbi:MAG: sialate O-acetylesterase, partial [Ilumatobacter sp.]|nr:sialate O-acetylesterase [Ilumatobacter sp.]
MVIQRDSLIRVWGWHEPGLVVQVSGSWDPTNISDVMCNTEGKFIARLDSPPAGGPHTITVTSGTNTIVVNDVLSGEVWLCSGQSNMDWHMEWTTEGQAEIPQSAHSNIRLFRVDEVYDIHPQEDVVGSWKYCEPWTVASFSAVAYFFGKELSESLNDVPIGLVNASVGGTVIESWTSEASLRAEHDFDVDLDHLQRLRDNDLGEDLSARQLLWWNHLQQHEVGHASRWFQSDFDASAWPRVDVPMNFSQVGANLFDGTVWLQRKITLPPNWDTVDLSLEIGAIDDMDLTYVNGVQVGQVRIPGQWNEDRAYDVPADVLVPGENTITVMVLDTGGAG